MNVIFSDEESQEERAQLVRVLRNLYAAMNFAFTMAQSEPASRRHEALICELVSIKEFIGELEASLRQTISLIGLQGYDEWEAARQLGVRRRTINLRLWRSAELIQKAWHTRRRVWSEVALRAQAANMIEVPRQIALPGSAPGRRTAVKGKREEYGAPA